MYVLSNDWSIIEVNILGWVNMHDDLYAANLKLKKSIIGQDAIVLSYV